ncbi:MAG: GTPase Era [Neisseriaceae bacterium]|nr:MAG: GTPase Era [Neisseriaceae bacterium]
MLKDSYKSGFISVVGRPNVGKSTLVNHLIGQKISITSKKAQTTRHKIKGIFTDETAQLIFIDTPGFQTIYKNSLNQKLNDNVIAAIKDSDVVLFVVEVNKFKEADQEVINKIPRYIKTILVINKIDKFKHEIDLKSFIQSFQKYHSFVDIQTVSAKYNHQTSHLIEKIKKQLPEGLPFYPEDMLTDRSSQFLVSEIIREKIFRYIGEEIPYLVNIEIDSFEIQPKLIRINASILVDKINHKGMIIGKNGEKLKKIATKARLDIEKLLGNKIFLQTWVRVKSGWADDIRFSKELDD